MSTGRESLKDKVVGGAIWNVAAQITVQGTRILVGVVLAHLLLPRQYGVAGMAFVMANFLMIFSDISLGSALIQRPDLTEEDRSTVFWLTVAVGVACTAVGAGLSIPMAAFFHQPKAAPLFAALSLGFTLTALSSTQQALVTRELAFRTLQIREIASIVVGAAVAIAVAAAGGGAWAIVSQALATYAAGVALLWTLSPWRPQMLFSRRSFHDLGLFGVKLLPSRILTYINLNFDNLLVGRFLGSRALGIYSLAYNVMFVPMTRLAQPFGQVVFPAFARMQSDHQRLSLAWLRSKRLAAAVLAPVFFALLVVAPDFVPVVLGKKWDAAIPVLRLLCVAGVAHSLVTLNWAVLQAQGKAGLMFRVNVMSTAVIVAGFAIGLQWGVVGVAAGYAIAKWVLVVPDTWITGRPLSTRVWTALRTSGSAVPLAGVAALIAYGVRAGLLAGGVGTAYRLVLVLAVAGLAYVGLIAAAAPELIEEVKGLRGAVFRTRGLREAAEGAA